MNNNEKEEAAMFFDDPQMLSLGLDEQEHKNYSHNKITYNKLMSKIQAKARQEAKLNYCYYCKKEVSSFCNSHSVPQFCLRRIVNCHLTIRRRIIIAAARSEAEAESYCSETDKIL